MLEWVANMVYVGLQTFVPAKLVGKEQIVKFALDYPVVSMEIAPMSWNAIAMMAGPDLIAIFLSAIIVNMEIVSNPTIAFAMMGGWVKIVVLVKK